jgi:hypothetical protein
LAAAAVGIGSNFATGADHVGPGIIIMIAGLAIGILAILFTYLPSR